MAASPQGGRGSNQYRRRGDPVVRRRRQDREAADAAQWGHLDGVDCGDHGQPTAVRFGAWLRRQPPGAKIVWGQEHVHTDAGDGLTGWVDIRIPDAEEACRTGWVWTIVGPDDDTANDADPDGFQIVAPYDLDVHAVGDHDLSWAYRAAVPAGAPLPSDVSNTLTEHEQRVGTSRIVVGGWSAGHLSEVLHQWSTDNAGRPDIVFEYDAEFVPDDVAEADRIASAIAAGTEGTYDMGGGLRVSDSVMDTLLGMNGEDAGAMMKRARAELGLPESGD